jgi:hypothetical protein
MDEGAHVQQACGMIAVQAECDIGEAFALLVIRASSLDQSLHLTALDVLDRCVRFEFGRTPTERPLEGDSRPSDTVTPRHGLIDQEAPQAHAQEEAQEAAEEDPLAAPSAG